jgi:1,2-phenylacetyl-CoA epoxidase catalytic subunit
MSTNRVILSENAKDLFTHADKLIEQSKTLFKQVDDRLASLKELCDKIDKFQQQQQHQTNQTGSE